MSKRIRRVEAKDKPHRRGKPIMEMRCKCGNRVFRVFVEPIRRKEKTKKSPDLRIGIECPLCHAEKRLRRGGMN